MRACNAGCALALLAGMLAAQQPTVTTVLNNGTTNSRYDMVILGDGYQAHEEPQFDSDVNTFLTTLFQTQPYQTFASYYNVHTVFRASAESGADHPDASPPIYVNTAYDSSYNTGGTPRCLYVHNVSQALADAALAPATEGRVIVLVNDSRYGGCAGTFSVSYNGSQMSQVQIHELGHSLGQLADEYDYPHGTYTGPEPGQVNITTSPSGQKWSHWHGTPGISATAYQGAGYYLYGLYRSRTNCLMRSLGASLCAVCQENIVRVTNSVCNAIDSTAPATNPLTLNVGQTQTFSFTHFVPLVHNPVIEWKLDGNVLPGANASSYALDTTGLSLGIHMLTCSVEDQTPLVRLDPGNLMHHQHTWAVNVTTPSAANLRVAAMSLSQTWTLPGAPLTINCTVANDGPATASFDVEFFLGTTTTFSPNDTYLGREQIANLAATQQAGLQRQVVMPWGLTPGVQFVHAVVDRTNQVLESNENDNTSLYVVVAQNGPCVTKLEYTDPLLYPFDAATVSTSAGGTVHPTVIAPCAAPGTLYLIAWGCSGTSPGTTLSPSMAVPINQDFHTQLGLSLINGAMFQAFLGAIDAQGRGQATFDLPPGSGLWPSTGHFAALLVDSTPAFVGTTNPIAITILP